MSRVEVRERLRASPPRARSLLTVRAAISSALLAEEPRLRWLALMCWYWRARLVPLRTPRGGMWNHLSLADSHSSWLLPTGMRLKRLAGARSDAAAANVA